MYKVNHVPLSIIYVNYLGIGYKIRRKKPNTQELINSCKTKNYVNSLSPYPVPIPIF